MKYQNLFNAFKKRSWILDLFLLYTLMLVVGLMSSYFTNIQLTFIKTIFLVPFIGFFTSYVIIGWIGVIIGIIIIIYLIINTFFDWIKDIIIEFKDAYNADIISAQIKEQTTGQLSHIGKDTGNLSLNNSKGNISIT